MIEIDPQEKLESRIRRLLRQQANSEENTLTLAVGVVWKLCRSSPVLGLG